MITRGVLDMKVAILTALSGMLLMGATLPAFAETNRWAGYTGVDTQRYQHHPAYPQHRPYYSQHPQPQYYPRHYPQHHPRPAPPRGMYWVFEHGRYVLVANR